MSFVIVDFSSGSIGSGAPGGHVWLFSPEGVGEELEIPEQAFPVLERVSTAPWVYGDKARLFLAGGFSDTLMVTEQKALVRCFITPTDRELVLSATPLAYQIGLQAVAGSSGPTGEVIWFIRWRDPIHGRRSPFSAPSPTMTLDGTKATKFYNLPLRPTPDDLGVTEIEFWANINGTTDSRGRLLIKRIATRDSGAATVTITETAELESETEQGLQAVPRGTMNVIYHNRRWWNDPKNPNRVCFSPLDRPDEWGGGYRTTRNGEDVTGLAVIRDTLCIFGANSSYRLNGYTESDFIVDGMDPFLGCLNHFGIQKIGQVAMVPTMQGFAVCTGNSMRLIRGDYQKLWKARAAGNARAFMEGFAVNDTVAGVYKFYEPALQSSGIDANGRMWVLEYDAFGLSADSAAPFLSFDRHAIVPKCAAMLSDPRTAVANCFTAFQNGMVAQENDWQNATDVVGAHDVAIITSMLSAEIGGGPWDGLQLNDLWLFLSSYASSASFSLNILYGNEFAMIGTGPTGNFAIETVGALLAIPPPALGAAKIVSDFATFSDPAYLPQALFWRNLALKGDGFAIRIIATDPTKLVYRGLGMTVQPGAKAPTLPFGD